MTKKKELTEKEKRMFVAGIVVGAGAVVYTLIKKLLD